MKIILSPTKTMKRKKSIVKEASTPFFDESETLRDILKTYSFDDLKKLYKSSDKIINNTMTYYSDPLEKDSALNLYDGLVYKQLDLSSFNEENMTYLNNHVIILSALYGALYPGSLIQEYRLDYLMKFEVDLYDYWKDNLKDFFKEDDFILNLASSEFSLSVDHSNIVNVHFVDENMKTKSTAAKMARGNMLDYLIKNNITDLENVKKYKGMNYHYLASASDKFNLYFMQEVL